MRSQPNLRLRHSIFLTGLTETTKTRIKEIAISAEIRTEHIPHACQKRYSLNQVALFRCVFTKPHGITS